MSTVTPLAALTTIFTPPCPISYLLTTTAKSPPSQYPPFPTAVPSCDLPSWALNLAAKAQLAFYSPAICPSGFSVGPGCSSTAPQQQQRQQGFPAVEPGETAVFCVPSGHSCTTDATDFQGGVWGVATAAAAATTGGVFTVGPALQIRFREADLSLLETHPLSQQATAAAVSVTVGGGGGGGGQVSPVTTAATTTIAGSSSSTSSVTTESPPTINSATTSSSSSPSSDSKNKDNNDGLPAATTAVLVASILAAFAVGIAAISLRFPRSSSSTKRWWPWKKSQRHQHHIDEERNNPAAATPHQPPVAELEAHVTPAVYDNDNDDAYSEQRRRRASWISRFLSRITTTTTTTTTTSTSMQSSRWTGRSLRFSGDWAPLPPLLVFEKDGGGGDVAPMLPEVAYSRPSTLSWGAESREYLFLAGDQLGELPKVRSFDRVSEGTFGRVLVLKKSMGASSLGLTS